MQDIAVVHAGCAERVTVEGVAEAAAKAAEEANKRQAAEERRNAGATFEKATKYSGAKLGRVFQLGAAGLGYYADCGHIVKLDLAKSLFQAGVAPVVPLVLDKLVPPRPSCDKGTAFALTKPKNRRRTRQRVKQAKTYAASLHPLHVDWPDDDSVSLYSTVHKAEGMFALDQLNPNCWATAVSYCSRTTADFACFQETRVWAAAREETEHGMKLKQWSASISPCVAGPKGGPSAGVAVCVRSHVGMRCSTVEAVKGDGIGSRVNLKWIGAAMPGGFHCGSLYLHDGIGLDHELNLKVLQGIAARVNLLQGPLVLSADWNGTPEELVATGFLKLIGGHIIRPVGKTCSAGKGRILDYFVVSSSMLPYVRGAFNVEDAGASPHSPVRLIFGSTPRKDTVRMLKVPKSHPPVLPHGPDRQCVDDPAIEALSDDELGENYVGCIAAIERQLNDAAGLDVGEATHFTGRVDGPNFETRQVGNSTAADAKTTAASRAWRRSAEWLRKLRVVVSSKERLAVCWRLFHYKHPRPDFAAATEAQAAAFAEFEAWRTVIARTYLSDEWVDIFRDIALGKARQQEAQAQRAQLLAWRSWMHEGPAGGLRKQHQFTKVKGGWVEAAEVAAPVPLEDSLATEEGVSLSMLKAAMQPAVAIKCPANLQEETDLQAVGWHREWGSELTEVEELHWPQDVGPVPARMLEDAILDAAMTFPIGTGLGWDGLHPRCLTRVSRSTIRWVSCIMQEAERTGGWHMQVGAVVIVLIPKGDGTYRPIGLLPWMPRLWMRSRRIYATNWEKVNSRDWIYAGVGKGADIAAWNQAARAELAAVGKWKTGYAQALLDLVKAFERVPYWLLVQEAVDMGYPVWLLRLSIATYKLPRTLRVGKVCSALIIAVRGITAGSGLATTEMRLAMVRKVERALSAHPSVVPTLFVDDLSAECTGPEKVIEAELVPFINKVAADIEGDGMELSRKKCVCTASSDQLGHRLAACWAHYGINYQRYVKSLGVGLGAGVRRNAGVMKKRLDAFKARIPLFQRLRHANVDPAKIIRTGGKAAVVYGQAVLGVANGLLRHQRVAVARAGAKGGATGGQQLDLALMMMDGGPGGGADPAFDAHTQPIVGWSRAVWNEQLPRKSLKVLAANALLKLSEANNVWAMVVGPGSAFVATCARIGWAIIDGVNIRTDSGFHLDLTLDPPAAVHRQVVMAVERWRWRNVEDRYPELAANGTGRGAMFEAIWSLMRSKTNDETWGPKLKGALISQVSARQFTQARVFAAGWSDHNRCLACLQQIVLAEESGGERELRLKREEAAKKAGICKVQATEDQIARAPVGNEFHRIWSCPTTEPSRRVHASSQDRGRTKDGWGAGLVMMERALIPRPPPPPKPPLEEASFHWYVQPQEGLVCAKFYTDGSALDGPWYDLMRCGWAFVALDDDNHIVAAAYGATPPWIRDIGGAEGWALLQAAYVAFPGSCFVSDCKVIVDTLKLGRHAAVGGGSTHARIYALLFAVFDDTADDLLVWMPAHQGDAESAARCKSDGTPLTQIDVEANDKADMLAKRGVEDHRVPYRIRREWERCLAEAKARARWIARATLEATNMQSFPFADSESSRKAAEEAKKKRRDGIADGSIVPLPRGRNPLTVARPPSLGGHLLEQVARAGKPAVTCSLCRTTSTKVRSFAAARCQGSAADKWARRAVAAAEKDSATGRGHHRILSGDVLWCRVCGCYADAMARGLATACKGKPPTANSGGRLAQLKLLRAGRHPLTRERLPPAIDELGQCLLYDRGVAIEDDLLVARRSGRRVGLVESATTGPQVGRAAEDKRQRMLVRLCGRLAKEARDRKRMRKVEARASLKALIDSFAADPVEGERERAGEVDSDEEFWNNLPVGEARHERLLMIPIPPVRGVRGMVRAEAKGARARGQVLSGRRCTVLNCFSFGCDGGHVQYGESAGDA